MTKIELIKEFNITKQYVLIYQSNYEGEYETKEELEDKVLDSYLEFYNIDENHPLISYIDEPKLINDLLQEDYTLINLNDYKDDENLDIEIDLDLD